MPGLEITRRTVRALAGYHALLHRCERLGNIARARSRVLREEWSACGMERARRGADIGRHVFHGVLLTPRAADSVDRGVLPAQSGLVLHAGVLLEESLPVPGALLMNAEMPELQVGLMLGAFPELWPAHAEVVEALFGALESAGFDLFRETSLRPGMADAEPFRWFAATRRLSLASLLDEEQPGLAAGRFFARALRPLEQFEDEQVESLLRVAGHGEVYEREVPV